MVMTGSLWLLIAAAWGDRDEQVLGDAALAGLAMALAFWTVTTWRVLSGRWLDGYAALLWALLLFSLSNPVLTGVGWEGAPILERLRATGDYRRAVLLSVGAIAAYHMGGLAGLLLLRKNDLRHRWEEKRDIQGLTLVGASLIAVSAVPSALLLYGRWSTVTARGYFGLYQQQLVLTGVEAWKSVLAAALLPGCLLLLAGSRDSNVRKAVAWVGIGIPAAIYLVIGLRGAAIQGLVAAGWLHHYAVKRIRPVILLTGILGLAGAIPLVGRMRSEAGGAGERLRVAKLIAEEMRNPLEDALGEMGGSVFTVVKTVEAVPSVRPFGNGESYVRALGTVLPNVFSGVHPALSEGTLSDWLVWTVDPLTAMNGGGYGFSAIAEAYLNFSWIGAWVPMVLLGFLVGALGGGERGLTWAAAEAIVMSSVLVLARGESMIVVRSIVWFALIPAGMVWGLRNRRIARRSRGDLR
jgi:hypothetical protein